MTCANCEKEFIKPLKANNKTTCCSRNCSLALWRARKREHLREYSNDWLHRNQARHTEQNRLWRQRNRRKATVHTLTNRAIAKGKLIRKPCEVCSSEDVHAHHPDYSRHYSFVKWLCPLHHKQEHMQMGEMI